MRRGRAALPAGRRAPSDRAAVSATRSGSPLERRGGAPERSSTARSAQAHARAPHVRAPVARRAGRRALRIVELVTDSDDVADGPFDARRGRGRRGRERGLTMNLEHLKPGYSGLCYYRGPARCARSSACRCVEHGQLRGVLCADRLEDGRSRARDEEVLQRAVAQVLRAHRERARVRAARAQPRASRRCCYRASQALGAALTEEPGDRGRARRGRRDRALRLRGRHAATTPRSKHALVRRAVGEGADELANLTLPRQHVADRDGGQEQPLPAVPRRVRSPAADRLHAQGEPARACSRCSILPLLVREDAIGTLALAARRARRVRRRGAARRSRCSRTSSRWRSPTRAAVRRLEEMATTDGLTGLPQQARVPRASSSEDAAAAERFRRKLLADRHRHRSLQERQRHLRARDGRRRDQGARRRS